VGSVWQSRRVFLARWIVRLALVALVLLVVAAIAGDFWARSEAQKLLADRVRTSTHSQRVSVHISSFPFLYDLAVSRVPEVKVVADGVPVGVLPLSQVTVDARQVQIDHHSLLSGKLRVASISKATVTILIQATELVSLAKALNAGVSVVSGHRLVVTVSGHQVLSIDLTSNPLVPDCAFALQGTQDGYSLTCTVAPVPPSLLTALSPTRG